MLGNNPTIRLKLCRTLVCSVIPFKNHLKFINLLPRFTAVLILMLLCFFNAHAQDNGINNIIYKGNEAYKKGDFNFATEQYKEALRKDPANDIARFNLANALQKQNQEAQSEKEYEDLIQVSKDASINTQAFYNKGLAQLKQSKLPDAIYAFKESLKLNPDDNDTRENLQLAINQLKKQTNNQQQNNQNQNKKQPQQKPQKVDKQMMEQKLNELRNQEKQLQKRLQKKSNSGQPEKDW